MPGHISDRRHPSGTTYNAEMIHTGSGDINMVVGEQHNYGGVPTARQTRASVDIGVITVLHQEARAVVRVFENTEAYHTRQLPDGTQTHLATFPGHGGKLRAAALQAPQPGTHSAIEAYHRMKLHYSPKTVLLVGIAGAIRTGGDVPVDVGDVVLSDQVIYYDPRRETPGGPRHRGQAYPGSPVLQNRVNEFVRVHGASFPAPDGSWFRLHRGPIGSGNAVIADANSGYRRYLHEVHEKTVAVDTESAGIAHACHEDVQTGGTVRGWLAIRGISDQADAAKGHTDHDLASARAALVLHRLLPYLWLEDAG